MSYRFNFYMKDWKNLDLAARAGRSMIKRGYAMCGFRYGDTYFYARKTDAGNISIFEAGYEKSS